MTRRRIATDIQAPAPEPPIASETDAAPRPIQARMAQPFVGARSREEAEERYVAARNAWTLAMRDASSGRPADLASLAIAQETYEVAHAERERWLSGVMVAIPVEPDRVHEREVEAAIRHELAWRVVLDQPKPEGVLTRLRRRIRGG